MCVTCVPVQKEEAGAACTSAQARAETAIGRHTLRPSPGLGVSPPGSFESEVLAFMSATGPQSRSRRRNQRKARPSQVRRASSHENKYSICVSVGASPQLHKSAPSADL